MRVREEESKGAQRSKETRKSSAESACEAPLGKCGAAARSSLPKVLVRVSSTSYSVCSLVLARAASVCGFDTGCAFAELAGPSSRIGSKLKIEAANGAC